MKGKIVLKNVSKFYQKGKLKICALKDINLEIEKSEFTVIMGPSGSGKTTLLNLIGCLDVPTEGEISYDGVIIKELKEDNLADFRRKNIGFIFQSYNLIPVLTVKENIELALILDKTLDKTEKEKRVLEIIEKVGLKGLEDRYPLELSGGQEQRVAIARALVKKPLLVLADEPTAHLDSNTALEIIQLMRQLNEYEKITFLFSTHDIRIEKFAKRVIVLKDGKIDQDIKV